MGLYSNAKANALIRDLGNKLQIRLANGAGLNTVVLGFYTDSNGAAWPYLLLSNATDGVAVSNPVVYIEISCVDMVSKDIFGNQESAYAPHVLQLGYELGTGEAPFPIPSRADVLVCINEATKTGVRMQIKEVANGTAVTGASVNAAAPIADLEDLYWPTKSV